MREQLLSGDPSELGAPEQSTMDPLVSLIAFLAYC